MSDVWGCHALHAWPMTNILFAAISSLRFDRNNNYDGGRLRDLQIYLTQVNYQFALSNQVKIICLLEGWVRIKTENKRIIFYLFF
jgi:hypothetical protein